MLLAAAALFLALCPALAADSDPQDPVLLAVTRSGVRLEVLVEPVRGALEIETPYGVLSTPTDPVAVVLHSVVRRDWLLPAFQIPGRSSLELIEELRADGRIGELLELAKYAEGRWTAADDSLRLIALHTAIESWGARLRQVPSEVNYVDRPEYLWKQILREDGPRIHLLIGALVEELPRHSDTSTSRRLPSSALSDGYDHRRPAVRRAAALAAGKQNDSDRLRLLFLLDRSLRERHASARDGFGRAAADYWTEAADAYWFRAVTRAKDAKRMAAAEQLAAHGGDRAIDYLAFSLSVHDQRIGRRFELAGKDVQVVRDTKSPGTFLSMVSPGGDRHSGVPYAITPDVDRFEHTSVIKVVKLDPVVTETLVKALARITGEQGECTAEAWMDWYRARVKA